MYNLLDNCKNISYIAHLKEETKMYFKPEKNIENCRILITNDDGIDAYGIKLLEYLLLKITPNVMVVAPKNEKSGAGHSLTSDKLRSMYGHTSITEFPNDIFQYDSYHYAVDGTPCDCVRVALNMIMRGNYPDLIISGINNGRNIADDVTYSGTIGAAMEGILYGIPSIAVSQLVNKGDDVNWQIAEKYLAEIIKKIRLGTFSADTLININFPNLPTEELKGIEICRQGSRRFVNGTVENSLLCTKFLLEDKQERSAYYPDDNEKIATHITITPLKVNLTDERGLDELKKLFLENIT